ncbi:MAG: DUF126 domain-containing protein [Inquilinus sp.]|nr:DUF126 domain-containing protein [Inquilinus sp.]
MALSGRTLFPGRAEGVLLKLGAPLSFWGGVDPDSGRIVDGRHPQRGAAIGGTVLAVPRTVGSSSSSAVMLELIRAGHAPAALVLGQVDAILIVGCLAGRELGYACPPVLEMAADRIAGLATGRYRVAAGNGDGVLEKIGPSG